MLISGSIETLRTMRLPKGNYRPVLEISQTVSIAFRAGSIRERLVPHHQIEQRFGMLLGDGNAVEKSVEEFCQRFGRPGLNHEHSAGKKRAMVQRRLLDGRDIMKSLGVLGIEQGLNRHFKRHHLPRTGLEMHMLPGGSSALGAIVQEGEIGIMMGEVRHIHKPVEDGLGRMFAGRYGKMLVENRIRIDENLIFAAFAGLEADYLLRLRAILLAEDALLTRRFFR